MTPLKNFYNLKKMHVLIYIFNIKFEPQNLKIKLHIRPGNICMNFIQTPIGSVVKLSTAN